MAHVQLYDFQICTVLRVPLCVTAEWQGEAHVGLPEHCGAIWSEILKWNCSMAFTWWFCFVSLSRILVTNYTWKPLFLLWHLYFIL